MEDVIGIIAHELITKKVSPSLIVTVQQHRKEIFKQAYGNLYYSGMPICPAYVKTSTYDIASITEVFTSTAILLLVEKEIINLEDKVSDYISKELVPFGDKITIKDLLTHTTGIQAHMSKLATNIDFKDNALRYIGQNQLKWLPGTNAEYTNVNMFLLGRILEIVKSKSLSQIITQLVLEPLNMKDTSFYSSELPHINNRRCNCAPTEVVDGLDICGVVHDESTRALGGVAGHAGLFSTARDLQKFAQFWLDQFKCRGGYTFRNTANIAKINYTRSCKIHSGLGWMLNRPWMGKFMLDAIGHSAFTGPYLLINYEHDLAIVILMNRTYPKRTDRTHVLRNIYARHIINSIHGSL
ncbi:beta-lactamase family protein [Patescibacteria group bacterium]|nr:beta-lactamase family protein [Patescibacteria group bacterium]